MHHFSTALWFVYSQCNLIKLKICYFHTLFFVHNSFIFSGPQASAGGGDCGGGRYLENKRIGGCRIRGAAGGGVGAIIRPNPPQSESEQRPIRQKKMPRTGREI